MPQVLSSGLRTEGGQPLPPGIGWGWGPWAHCREAQIKVWPAHAGSGQVWGPGSVGQRPLRAAGGQPLPSPAPWPSSSPPPSRSPSAAFSGPTSGCVFTRKHVLLQRSGVSPHPPGFCRISSPGHEITCLKKLGLAFFFFFFSFSQ